MHTFGETGQGVPAFLAKLWRLVDDPDTNNLICWSKDGRSFIIQNQAQFARELLPQNYKHNNMASFIRQLNMYGFHKITSIDNGGLKFDRDEMEFSHPCFKRNCPYLLEHIKRKIANTKALDEKATGLKPEAVTKVLQDVKAMRGRQDSLDSRFSVMKQENEALWREIASLRQKHAKQQQIVNKLIQFLITIVQPSRNMNSVKRHMQLMIDNAPENVKLRKTSEFAPDGGPVIHELGEDFLDDVVEKEEELMNIRSPYSKESAMRGDTDSPTQQTMERPNSSISLGSQNYDYSNQSMEDAFNVGDNSGSDSGAYIPNKKGSIIKTKGPDGSPIIYHVTEMSDGQDATGVSPNYSEENVLTTPLMKQELARSEILKQMKRRKDVEDVVAAQHAKLAKIQRTIESELSTKDKTTGTIGDMTGGEELNIKSERVEIDPMMFLNIYSPAPEETAKTPQLVSPNLSEDSRQSGNVGIIVDTATPKPTTETTAETATGINERSLLNTEAQLYNPEEFISNDMPANIFDDSSSMLDDSNLSEPQPQIQPKQPQQSQQQLQSKQQPQPQQQSQQQQQQKQEDYLRDRTDNNANGNAPANGASTSAQAAAAAAGTAGNVGANPVASTSAYAAAKRSAALQSQGKNGNAANNNNMAVAKYKSAGPNEEIMRLSSADEVNGHLDNLQDELESLKDLLRSDSYSLDAATLMGLFSDSDILGPYGLHLSNEASNDKKGSELMTYQPLYDLSDIMDIEDKPELDQGTNAGGNGSANSSGLNTPFSRSVLNTPHHE